MQLTWSVGSSEKSSGGFVITYRFDDASHEELVSRNLSQYMAHTISMNWLQWQENSPATAQSQQNQICSILVLLQYGNCLTAEELVWRKTNLIHNLFLVYFVSLYMFRAYLHPSSGGTTICIQQLVLIFLFKKKSCCIYTVVPPDDGPRYAWNR